MITLSSQYGLDNLLQRRSDYPHYTNACIDFSLKPTLYPRISSAIKKAFVRVPKSTAQRLLTFFGEASRKGKSEIFITVRVAYRMDGEICVYHRDPETVTSVMSKVNYETNQIIFMYV